MSSVLASLKGGLIVSCQAPAHSPLHNSQIIAAFAQTAMNNGAVGVRIDSPAHIQAVRQQLPTTPIIGLWKRFFNGYDVYITPRFTEAEAICQAGADILAIDATDRPRPDGQTLAGLVERIHQELGKPVMADIDTLENARLAVAAGADCVGTTLYGYTSATQDGSPPGFSLLASLRQTLTVPLLCEGGIASPEAARQAFNLGAYAVVVGTAITGIDAQVKAYSAACNPQADS